MLMISLLVGSAIAWKTSRLMINLFRNRLVTQIYMKPFGYTKFFLNFFKKWGKLKDRATVNPASCTENHLLKQGLRSHQWELIRLLHEVSYRNRADRSLS